METLGAEGADAGAAGAVEGLPRSRSLSRSSSSSSSSSFCLSASSLASVQSITRPIVTPSRDEPLSMPPADTPCWIMFNKS